MKITKEDVSGRQNLGKKFKYVYPHKYGMANMTLSIPDDLIKRMRKFREVKWSEVARQAIERRITEFEEIEKIASKSKLTEKDAREIADKINEAVARKLKLL